MQITFLTLCVDVHKNDAISNGEILMFWRENHILVSYDK